MALNGKITTNDYLNRYYILTWSAVQSIEKNQSTISWTVSCAGRSGEWLAERTLKVVLAGRTLISKTDRVQRYDGNIASGSFTVDHDSNGYLSISGSVQVAVYTSSVNCTGSGSWVLDSIARKANILTAEDFTDEENPTITYNNPAGKNISSLQACISFTGANDDISYRDIAIDGSSYTFELTDDERNVLLNNTLDGKNSRNVTFFIKTVISGNTFYSTLTKTFTVVNSEPTLSPTVKDVNPTTLAITNNADIFIRHYSNAQISIGAKAYKNASIVSESAVCGSGNITEDSGVIKNVDSANFIFSAIDNRGNSVTASKTVSFIEYIKTTCNLMANPSDAEGKLKFLASGIFYNNVFGTKSNVLTLEYCYSEDNGEYTEWEVLTYALSGNEYSAEKTIEGLDYQKKYIIKVRAKDLLSESITTSKVLKTIPVFDWGEEDFNFNVPVKARSSLIIGSDEINVEEKLNELNNALEYYSDSMTGLTVEDSTNAYILSIVVKGNVAQLSLQAKTTATLSEWANLLELDSNALAFIKEHAKPQSFVCFDVKDYKDNQYFFKYVTDTPYLWMINSVASGVSLHFTCTWIVKNN